MKNYLKLIVAVFGLTIATFGSFTKASAIGAVNDNVKCVAGTNHCGWTKDCREIIGTLENY